MPRVSVVIPTYNRAHFVREAIESVLRQTYRDFELIVIDDGSTDNTKEVVNNFNDPRIKYIYQENQGVSKALNTGIEASHAEYIAMHASDNILLEDALQKCINFMDPHPEVGFCYGQFFTMDERGHLLRSRKPRGPKITTIDKDKKEITRLLLGESSPSCFFVRRSCFKNIGLYNTELPMSEDWDMVFRLSSQYAVGKLAEPIRIVRNHEQSMIASYSVEVLKDVHVSLLESFFKDHEFSQLYGHLREKAYFSMYCILARTAARTRHRGKGLFYLLTAMKESPRSLLEIRGIILLMRTGKSFLPFWLSKLFARCLVFLKLR